jgi:hypothetical protein
MFFLYDRVDDVTFEEGQEQEEEDNQQFDEEGKWNPPTYSIFILIIA